MLSAEVTAAVEDVVKLLFKAPVRGFVPELDCFTFVDRASIPLGTQMWLESTAGKPQNAIAQLLILSQDPLAHTRGEESHPFIISKDHRTDGWQTASAIALEAAIKTQWPTNLDGISDITQRPRLQTSINSICEQTVPGTKMAHLMDAIQLCLHCLSVTATTEDVVEKLKQMCATAIFLGLDKAQKRALEGVYTGLADLYAGHLELGEARYDIASDLDVLDRYTQKALSTPLIGEDNPMTAGSIKQMKILIREKLHKDIEDHRVSLEASKPSTHEHDYTRALVTALHRLHVPSSITLTFQQAR